MEFVEFFNISLDLSIIYFGDWGISGVRQWRGHWHTYGVSMAHLWRTLAYPWRTYIVGNGNINFVTPLS